MYSSKEDSVLFDIARSRVRNSMIFDLEDRIAYLFSTRHEYPIWPSGDYQMDALQREMHDPIRSTYYGNIHYLVQLTRKLKG